MMIKVLKQGNVPRSIAFIMDGNRRYATNKSMKKHEGHEFGFQKLRGTLNWGLALGVKEMTVYALSIDNLARE